MDSSKGFKETKLLAGQGLGIYNWAVSGAEAMKTRVIFCRVESVIRDTATAAAASIEPLHSVPVLS